METSVFILKISNLGFLANINKLGESADKVDNIAMVINEAAGMLIIKNLADIYQLVLSPSKRFALKNNTKVLELKEEQMPEGPTLF